MYIETERLIIRSLEPEDAAAYIEMASDGSLWEIFGDCSCCHEWIGSWIEDAKNLERENRPDREYLAYAVTDRQSGAVLGAVGCSYYEDLKKTGITYFIGAAYRGRGYAAEAAAAYAEYFFKNYEYSELIATVKAENIPSWKSVERAGFVLKGIKPYRDIYDSREEPYRFYSCSQTAHCPSGKSGKG